MSGEKNGEGTTRRLTLHDLGLDSEELLGGQGDIGPLDLLIAWFQLFRTAQIHSLDNRALERPIARFKEVIRVLVTREGSISFQTKDGTFFVNGVKLRLSSDLFDLAQATSDFFDDRGMGGFIVDGTLDTDGVRRLLDVLVRTPAEDLDFARLSSALGALGVPFRLNRPLGSGRAGQEATLERRTYTFYTYSKLVVLYRNLLADAGSLPIRRQFLFRKLGRTVQALVDICLEDDYTFLGLTAVKSGKEYLPHHAANVTVLAIALGEKLGLDKVELADLGMAALFRDVGLREIEPEVLRKEGALEQEDRATLERHTLRSVEFLLADRRLSNAVLSQIVVAFEHHRRADGGGYPRLSRPPALFSRIVSIADAYDAMTTDRPWRRAYLPDEALGLMLAESGKQFDSSLLKVFVNTLGFYPIGTLVRLSSRELGLVVYGSGVGERATRPIVAPLDVNGTIGTEVIDLMDRDARGDYLRTIVSSEDPTRYGLSLAGLLVDSPLPS